MSAGPDVVARDLVSVDPATLEPVGRVPITPSEELSEVISEARMTQAQFAQEPLDARRRLLEGVAHAIVEDDEAIARTIVAESGKPLAEAYVHDLIVAADSCTWLAANLAGVLREERFRFSQLVLRHKRGVIRHEPLGVVAVVSPWNFPLALPLRHAAAAVAAGNAVVVKPSELAPLSGAWVEELFRRAGAPPGLVRVVQGGAGVGDELVRHRGIGGIVFTGSSEVGKLVAQAAAERLRPAVLELGGKDPMLVLEDADLDRAVAGALWGSFTNCGQACAGIERIVVAPSLREAFVERLAARTAELRVGHGADPHVELGPLVSEAQRARFESLLADAVERGAEVVVGGARPPTALPGWFHEPTVVVGEPPQARIRSEELFGPAVVVVEKDNEEEMVRWANDSTFGLGASVWSRNLDRAGAIAARLDAGMVWVNDHAYSFGAAQAPWAGRRSSGLGTTTSRHGLHALSRPAFSDADRGRLTPGWWFPYSERAIDGFRGVLGGLYADGLGMRAERLWSHRRGLAHLVGRALR